MEVRDAQYPLTWGLNTTFVTPGMLFSKTEAKLQHCDMWMSPGLKEKLKRFCPSFIRPDGCRELNLDPSV